ncbi:hypothetical protein HNP33_004062 [Comamonas odontotermitis]|uniref:Uncharacterized protein n=1 Tax=Comamonas odontotermitis TaxID=379895 RepID=A0ABR6RL88_9BURK|nr:hypothetical protein [Comamonas odontotermitis]MBB6579938.1 hypothetical protein [Comamonas odontotermitis]
MAVGIGKHQNVNNWHPQECLEYQWGREYAACAAKGNALAQYHPHSSDQEITAIVSAQALLRLSIKAKNPVRQG